jgi:hypothetical protein
VWLASFGDVLFLLVAVAPLGLPLLAPSLVLLLQRHTRGDRRLLVLSVALFVSCAAVIRVKTAAYAILLSPSVELLAAAFLVGYLRRLKSPWYRVSRLRYAAPIVVVGVTVFAMKVSLAPVFGDLGPDTTQTFTRVAAAVPPDATVMGPQTYWFGLPPSQRYLSWEQLLYYQEHAPKSTLEDAFRALGVDYFIVDTRMERLMPEDAGSFRPGSSRLELTRANLASFLSRHARPLDHVETGTFGDVRIFKID